MKYIIIVIILVVIVGGGVLAYQSWWLPNQEPEGSYIKITSPNGGEQWIIGNTYNITWESSFAPDEIVKITLIPTSGLDLVALVENTGSFTWHIHELGTGAGQKIQPGDYKIKICIEEDGSGPCDTSDSYFSVTELEEETYNHAARIVKIHQKDGKDYLDINFIKFLLFVDEDGHPANNVTSIYGENDEEGDCEPGPNPYCIVDNDKTIESYEVSEDVVIIPSYYPGAPIPYEDLDKSLAASSFFRIQIENNIIEKMHQIYVP